MNFFFRKTIWVLLTAFLISVAVRIPNLDRPLSKHHEFCTSFALIIMQAWYDGGIATYGLNPSITYPGRSNEYIDRYAADYMQRDGRYFYISHPPLAYYLPYFTFALLKIYPDALALQVFNLLFHFLTALILYLSVCIITRENALKQFSPAAFFAALFYLFMPATLWFNSNVYMADMFVQNTWIISLYFLLKNFYGDKEQSILYLTLFGGSLFLMIYTDWPGAFFATGIALVCAQKIFFQKKRKFIPLLVVTIVATLLSLAVIMLQYSTIAGWAAMFRYFLFNYNEMGIPGLQSGLHFFQIVITLVFNYAVSYLPLLIFLAVGSFLIFRKSVEPSVSSKDFFLVMWLTLFPVFLDHLIFPEYSPQDFSVLKASFFICITSGILLSELIKTFYKQAVFKTSLITFSICAMGIAMYYYINPPGKYSFKGDRYDLEKNTGSFIGSNSGKDEVAFTTGIEITPQVMYYAHRNIKNVNNSSAALSFLRAHQLRNGIIFSFQNDSLQYNRIIQP
ncbi:MAG TPA: hypothetical protein VE978_06365 [Chitinophagales bacterium]|nr:hypothetical protein [Chitinophagales bacterium]